MFARIPVHGFKTNTGIPVSEQNHNPGLTTIKYSMSRRNKSGCTSTVHLLCRYREVALTSLLNLLLQRKNSHKFEIYLDTVSDTVIHPKYTIVL